MHALTSASLCRIFAAIALGFFPVLCHAASGTEAASFMDIPVGARPIALGGAYTALAGEGFAAIWNPAGLGLLKLDELSSMHLSYLDSSGYEYIGFAHPFNGQALAAAVQYFDPGTIRGMDATGAPLGDVSSSYQAYTLTYGGSMGERWSAGLAGRVVRARISDISAQAYAADLGLLFRPTASWSLGASLVNVGSSMKFIKQRDPLPMSAHLGAAVRATERLLFSTEGVYYRTKLGSARAGAEWVVAKVLAVRAGFRSETLPGQSPQAGVTAGLGISFWGQSFDYAWVPLGDLGTTQYFSLLIRFGRRD